MHENNPVIYYEVSLLILYINTTILKLLKQFSITLRWFNRFVRFCTTLKLWTNPFITKYFIKFTHTIKTYTDNECRQLIQVSNRTQIQHLCARNVELLQHSQILTNHQQSLLIQFRVDQRETPEVFKIGSLHQLIGNGRAPFETQNRHVLPRPLTHALQHLAYADRVHVGALQVGDVVVLQHFHAALGDTSLFQADRF